LCSFFITFVTHAYIIFRFSTQPNHAGSNRETEEGPDYAKAQQKHRGYIPGISRRHSGDNNIICISCYAAKRRIDQIEEAEYGKPFRDSRQDRLWFSCFAKLRNNKGEERSKDQGEIDESDPNQGSQEIRQHCRRSDGSADDVCNAHSDVDDEQKNKGNYKDREPCRVFSAERFLIYYRPDEGCDRQKKHQTRKQSFSDGVWQKYIP